jgi:hypothetical protein
MWFGILSGNLYSGSNPCIKSRILSVTLQKELLYRHCYEMRLKV